MTPILVGLVGPSGVGKSTVAKHLKKAHGFVGTHAGYPVKKAIQSGFDLDADHVDGHLKREPCKVFGGVTPKLVLDHAGEAIAKIAPLATATMLKDRLKSLGEEYPRVIVDGVRQQAEADVIRKAGGHIIRISPQVPPKRKFPMDIRSQAIKEDFSVDNTVSKKHTKKQLDKIMEKLGANADEDE
jgi:hypothetical protein